MKNRFFVLTVLILMLAWVAACAPAPTPASTAAPPTAAPAATTAPPTSAPAAPTTAPAARLDRNVKVGIIDTYSGPPAVFGNDALNGFKLAVPSPTGLSRVNG